MPVATLTGLVPLTLVTVPNGFVAQLAFVPSVVKYLPLAAAWLGAKALKASLAVACPVPPLAIGTVPTRLWSAFQSEGRTTLVSEPSATALTLLCFTVMVMRYS